MSAPREADVWVTAAEKSPHFLEFLSHFKSRLVLLGAAPVCFVPERKWPTAPKDTSLPHHHHHILTITLLNTARISPPHQQSPLTISTTYSKCRTHITGHSERRPPISILNTPKYGASDSDGDSDDTGWVGGRGEKERKEDDTRSRETRKREGK
ncbi:hypothetical protein Pcinc_028553 [Petrolisthes cinctipes]|uniref:Uncharacterized protein n=1 Tax=Petrolisthes cinctipes TaxID=88211 RepID=A0AAE1K8Q4_PETCI|nr:hypothetical protein Pcinc_028553 [Petrolisthes cinctipes]